jgi:hypothetical protein
MTDDELAAELRRRSAVLYSDANRYCEDARYSRDPDERQMLISESYRCDQLALTFDAAARGICPPEEAANG